MTSARFIFCILVLGLSANSSTCGSEPLYTHRALIDFSRSITVRILKNNSTPAGTGFFINDCEIATCFHVVSDLRTWGVQFDDKNNVTELKYATHSGLRALLRNGEIVPLELVSVPTKGNPEPLVFDFAVLRLGKPIKFVPRQTRRYQRGATLYVGEPVYFSGYPLETEILLTHQGTIAGMNQKTGLLALQASVNKGTSGSALLSSEGTVIGIISMRLGGIGKGLSELRERIAASTEKFSVQILDIDPLEATKGVIDVVDRTISTGIGYARSTIFLDKYLMEIQAEEERSKP